MKPVPMSLTTGDFALRPHDDTTVDNAIKRMRRRIKKLRRRRARRRSRKKTFNMYVKVDAATILPDHLRKWADYANYLQHRIRVGLLYWQAKKSGFVSLNRRTLERA